MNTFKKTTLALAISALAGGAMAQSAPASAPEPEKSPITANVTVVNDYRYRGISQSNFKPAIQGGFDYAHESGFYIGNWNSSISWIGDANGNNGAVSGNNTAGTSVSAPIEMDFYAGFKKELIGARGGLIDEAALKENLESGHVASAALDVFVEEPPKGSPLLGTKNLILTPHLGASTTEAQEKVAVQIAEQISDYLKTGAITNAVNTFSLTAKEYQSVKPFLKLSSLLGGFAGQLTENAIRSVQIEFEGTATNVNSTPLTQTIIYSLLKPTTESVNVINSVLVAKSKSISISEVKHQKENDYQSLIKLTVTTDKQTRSVSGTIFGGKARIVEVKGIKIEADLSEHNLYVSNQDKPGFIKDLSKILADNKINIATFHLGRLSSGGEAIAIISTDNKIENSVVESIKKIPLVIQAKYIQFKDKENE